MSLRGSKVEQKSGFIDTKYSCGDSNTMTNTSKQCYQEENNNEIDELSHGLSEMGCIVDAVKRPPNICVETCVYESDSDESVVTEVKEDTKVQIENEEPNYSDSFEEDKSEDEEPKINPKSAKSEPTDRNLDSPGPSNLKLSKSHSFMSSKANGSVSGKGSSFGQRPSLESPGPCSLELSKCHSFMLSNNNSPTDSPIIVHGKETILGSGPQFVPRTRRINMSFTNERLREIERHNHILLNKIVSARNNRKSSIPPPEQPPAPRVVPSAAVSRKRQQRQIDRENMILLRKIQRAKSSASSIRR